LIGWSEQDFRNSIAFKVAFINKIVNWEETEKINNLEEPMKIWNIKESKKQP
jgi:hypothetical protein